MVLKLFTYPSSSCARAVIITAKALEISFKEKLVDFAKNKHLNPEYLKINPQHTVPTLDDDGRIITDSHAINCYLVDKYGKDDSFYPKDLYKRALVNQRLAFDLGTLFPAHKIACFSYVHGNPQDLPRALEQIKEAYGFLEKFLEGKQWIAGDHVTIADFSCVTTVTCLHWHVNVDPKIYPNTAAWIKRVQALPWLDTDHKGLNMFYDSMDGLKKASCKP